MMNFPNITTHHDPEEGWTIINITQGRVTVSINCYDDDDAGTGIIDVCEVVPGLRSRRLAFVADGEETKVYGLDQFGREREVKQPIAEDDCAHHPTPESVQRAMETAEYREER